MTAKIVKAKLIKAKNLLEGKYPIFLIIGILTIIAMITSVIVIIEKQNNSYAFCSIVQQGSCQTVQMSEYSKVFGIDNAYFGIIGFAILTFAAFYQIYKNNTFLKKILIIGSSLAAMVAAYFIYLQWQVLHSWCSLCMIVDIISIILCILTLSFVAYNSES